MSSMNRKTFLRRAVSTGALLSLPAFIEDCASTALIMPDLSDALRTGEALKHPLLFALQAGMTAPNPHNSQAWKVRLRSDTEADLYVDRSRLLPDTDPPARQIHIGQGTFLEHLAVAVPEIGYRAEITHFPEGVYGPTDTGRKPVARIRLVRPVADAEDVASAPEKDPLFAAMALRTTNRRPFSGPALTAEEFRHLQASMRSPAGSRSPTTVRDPAAPRSPTTALHKDRRESTGCEVRFIETPADPVFLSLLKQAFALETYTVATNEETRRWFRFNDAEIDAARDGLSLRASGLSGINHFVVSRFMIENTFAYWNSEETKRYSVSMFEAQADSARGFALFKTKGNGFREHVQTGREFARFHLAAALLGFSLQPMSQVLQEYAAMQELRLQFERWAGVAPDEKVQMIVRLGRSDYFFRSPRRDVTAILEPSARG